MAKRPLVRCQWCRKPTLSTVATCEECKWLPSNARTARRPSPKSAGLDPKDGDWVVVKGVAKWVPK